MIWRPLGPSQCSKWTFHPDWDTRTSSSMASPLYLGELSRPRWFHLDVSFPRHTLWHSKISFHRFLKRPGVCIFGAMMSIRHDPSPWRGFGHDTPRRGHIHSTSLSAIERGRVRHVMPRDRWGPRVQPSLDLAVVFGFVLFRVCFLTHVISPDRAPHPSSNPSSLCDSYSRIRWGYRRPPRGSITIAVLGSGGSCCVFWARYVLSVWTVEWGSWHWTGDRDQDHPHGKESTHITFLFCKFESHMQRTARIFDFSEVERPPSTTGQRPRWSFSSDVLISNCKNAIFRHGCVEHFFITLVCLCSGVWWCASWLALQSVMYSFIQTQGTAAVPYVTNLPLLLLEEDLPPRTSSAERSGARGTCGNNFQKWHQEISNF